MIMVTTFSKLKPFQEILFPIYLLKTEIELKVKEDKLTPKEPVEPTSEREVLSIRHNQTTKIINHK